MFVSLLGFSSTLQSNLSAVATTMALPPADAAHIDSLLGGSDWSYLALSDGTNLEIVKVVAVSGANVDIIRGFDGTSAEAFPSGTCVRFVWGTTAIQDLTADGSFNVEITGTGVATVTETDTNEFEVHVPELTIDAGPGVNVLGAFPNFEISLVNADGNCCGCSSSGGGGVTLTGSGVVTVSAITGGYNVDVDQPSFTSSTPATLTIGGTWPNYTFSVSVSGGSGTVTSVSGGSGILISGAPAVTPTVSLLPTGVVAGAYGGMTLNAYGQATALAAGFSPVSTITSASAGLTSSVGPGAMERTLTLNAATTSQAGIVELAAATAIDSTNVGDTTSAVVPAGLAAALAALPAASIADGDKGDVSVSGAGTVWTIDAGVVTTTKLGGDITVAGKALLDDVNAAAQRTTLGVNTAAEVITQLTSSDIIHSASLVLPKTSGEGILIDTAAPDWGWRDITADINVKGSGANDPTFATYTGTALRAYQFSASAEQEVFLVFHVPHDYVPGTPIYFHAHWSNAAAVPNTGNVVWGFDYAFARGFSQDAFPAVTTTTVTQASSATRYMHQIAETIAQSIPNLEVDGLILCRVYRKAADANDTCSDAVFLHTADIHYQSSNIATKNKIPNFYT